MASSPFRIATLGPVLAGRVTGERHLQTWVKAAEAAGVVSGPWVLDFTNVHGTYSYFDATLGDLIQKLAADWMPGLLPVACNIEDDTIEELLPVLRLRGGALWVRIAGRNRRWRVAGFLDDSLKGTLLQLIASPGPVGSKELLESGKGISQSGWANRLTALVRLRLVGRERVGKKFEYRATPALIDMKTDLDRTNALFMREHHGVS